MAGTAAGGLIENHDMDLKTVCAVGAIVLSGTWTLSRRFQRMEDRVENMERMVSKLACVRNGTAVMDSKCPNEKL